MNKTEEVKDIGAKVMGEVKNMGKKVLGEQNKYPVMQFLGNIFDKIAILNAIGGLLIAIVSLIDLNVFGVIGGLLFGAITWALAKFSSECTKILSDIANNVDTIKNNSNYWKN